MKILRYIFIPLVLIMVIAGCYYDHANLVYPQPTNCVVSNITYSSSVVGILKTNCYSCHSGSASAGGGIQLDNYTSLKTYVSNGQLMNSLNHTGGVPAMPLTGSQLSACDILTIQTWINNGTPNN
ncbi:MAG: hypothetical protein JO080_07795 [Mucilaginibacter sp.]|nr:hypothetical protein [Mucilaginibacter sp.]